MFGTDEVVGELFRYVLLPGLGVFALVYGLKNFFGQIRHIRSTDVKKAIGMIVALTLFVVGIIIVLDGWIGDLLGPHKGSVALVIIVLSLIWVHKETKR